MKIPFRKKSMITISLLTLLSLFALANMTTLVNADTATKEPTLYINSGGFVQITWKSGKTQTYSSDAYVNFAGLYSITITPNHGWHIDAVFIDGNPQEILDKDGFSIINLRVKNTISITFGENGGVDDVKLGSNVGAYPDPYVALVFADVLVNGSAYAYTIGLAYLQPPNTVGKSWNITTDAVFSRSVTVILVLNLTDLGGADPTTLKLLKTEPELARADVNSDGIVDGTDVSIVAYANPSQVGDPRYNPRLDMNNDGVINDLDVNIVNNYVGQTVWQDITLQVVVSDGFVYVYGLTDQFSMFGVSR